MVDIVVVVATCQMSPPFEHHSDSLIVARATFEQYQEVGKVSQLRTIGTRSFCQYEILHSADQEKIIDFNV